MDDRIPPREPQEVVFLRRQTMATNPLLWIAGGIAGFLFAALGLWAAQRSPGNDITLHLQTSVPATLGLGAFLTAWRLARAPLEVGVGSSGLRITRRRGSQIHLWSRIGWSTVQAGALDHRRHLKVYDLEGRRLATLSQDLLGFDNLAEQVAARIAARQDGAAQKVSLVKARQSAVFIAVTSLVFLSLSAFVALETRDTSRAQRRLRESAVPGEARIERRFLAPNGITPRLVYRIDAPGGRSAERNVEVERPTWDALAGATTVPVLYVPDAPEISRLAEGEVEDRSLMSRPLFGYGVPAALSLMCCLFLVAAVLQWRGWDIDLDTKTGRLSIRRFGAAR